MKHYKNTKKKGGKTSLPKSNIVCTDYNQSTNMRAFWAWVVFSFISLICSLLQNKLFNKFLGTGCLKLDQVGEVVEDIYTDLPLRDNNCFKNELTNIVITGIGTFCGIISGLIQFAIFLQTLFKMY